MAPAVSRSPVGNRHPGVGLSARRCRGRRGLARAARRNPKRFPPFRNIALRIAIEPPERVTLLKGITLDRLRSLGCRRGHLMAYAVGDSRLQLRRA